MMSARNDSPISGDVLERIGIGLADQVARYRGMIEPLAEPMGDGGFQRVVMQNGRIDKGRELGLATDGLFSLAAEPRPDRIDRVESRLRLLLRHRMSPRPPAYHNRVTFYHIGQQMP